MAGYEAMPHSLREATNGRLQTQQPIFYNAQVKLEMGTWRRDTINDKDIPDNRKFTTMLSSGHGDAFDLLHILALDPAFYYNHQSKTLPRDHYVETRVNLFQSLNGMEIPREITTQEAFEDMFIYGGQPNRSIYIGKASQPATGVATMIAGSKNMWNYGHDTWFPGDKICWRMPWIDPEKREEERKKLPFDREHPSMRDRAILEVLTYEKSHHFLRDALTKSLDSEKRSSFSFLRLVPGADEQLGAVDRSIISIRNFLALHSFHTILLMLTYGLSPERVPGDGVDPFNPNNYNSNVGLEALSLDKVLKMQPRQQGASNLPPNAEMTSQEVRAFANKALFWAAKLGLLGRSVPEYVRPFHGFIDQVIGLTMRPWITNKEIHNFFSILRFFPDEMKQGITYRSRTNPNDMSQQYNLAEHVGSLLYCQSSLAKDFTASIGYAVERQANRYMVSSLNLTPPKEWGDTYR